MSMRPLEIDLYFFDVNLSLDNHRGMPMWTLASIPRLIGQ